MTSVEPGVLDANVLAYAINADTAEHVAARTLLEAARDPSTSLYVTSQILCEFYSIITNVRRFPKAVSPAEAARILSTILALPGLQIPPMPSQVVAGWIHLLGRHAVEGAGVFDLQIVATVLANGVQRIYTFNPHPFLPDPKPQPTAATCAGFSEARKAFISVARRLARSCRNSSYLP